MESSTNIRRILVTFDNPDYLSKIADYAIARAKKEHAQVVFLNVIETEPWLFGKFPYEWGTPEVLEKAYEKEKSNSQNIFDEIKRKTDPDVELSMETILLPRIKSKSLAVTDYAREHEIDLIIVKDKKRSRLTNALFRKTSVDIIKNTPCRVVTI